MVKLNIRIANLLDLDSLVQIAQRCTAYLNKQNIYQWDEIYPAREDFRIDIESHSLFVVIDDNEICGCICINQEESLGYENASWEGDKFFVVHKLMIDPKIESHGLGKFAMAYAGQLAQKSNMDSLRLDCFKENIRANQFYKKLGYSLKGETKFRKGLFNLYEKMI